MDNLLEFLHPLANASMAISGDGSILDVNAATVKLLKCDKHTLTSKNLIDLAEDPAEKIRTLIQRWRKSRVMMPGMVSLQVNGEKLALRCSGAVIRPHGEPASHVILLQLESKNNSIKEFTALNNKISQLDKEVKLRKKSQDALLKANSELETRVAERTQALNEALINSQHAAKAKAEFLANMSHEIRTPMNGVIGMLYLLRNTKLLPEQQDMANTASYSAESLLSLLNDVLDYSKIESGRIEIEEIEFNVIDLIEDIANLFAPKTEEKGVEIIVKTSNDLPPLIYSDPTRLRQVIMNLTGNAVKFTEGGEIVLAIENVACDGDHYQLKFSVKDTGIGIAEVHQSKVFELFKQADGGTTRKYGGTGLGLSISKHLVELLGGEFQLDSALNKGSTFSFVISVRAKHSQTSLEQKYALLQGTKALIVDDNKTNLQIIERLLEKWGMSYDSIEDSREAMAFFEQSINDQKPYDFILSDMMMPAMDGLALADKLLHHKNIHHTKFILLTSLSDSKIPDRARAMGIHACLSKPVRQAMLRDTMSNLLFDASHAQKVDEPINAEQTVLATINEDQLILIAEDNKINQKVVVGILKGLGYQGTIANNGQEAFDMVNSGQFAIVLMDVQMPKVDGYQATRLIRALNSEKKHIPIIAMTANAMEGDKEKCLAVGMNDYVSKPINVNELNQVLQNWLDFDGHEYKQVVN